jgi:response regulator RpfG family c-di-GMP phosphodiesterase
MKEARGRHFDPDVLDAFFAAEAQILDIKARCLDDGCGYQHAQSGMVPG